MATAAVAGCLGGGGLAQDPVDRRMRNSEKPQARPGKVIFMILAILK